MMSARGRWHRQVDITVFDNSTALCQTIDYLQIHKYEIEGVIDVAIPGWVINTLSRVPRNSSQFCDMCWVFGFVEN